MALISNSRSSQVHIQPTEGSTIQPRFYSPTTLDTAYTWNTFARPQELRFSSRQKNIVFTRKLTSKLYIYVKNIVFTRKLTSKLYIYVKIYSVHTETDLQVIYLCEKYSVHTETNLQV